LSSQIGNERVRYAIINSYPVFRRFNFGQILVEHFHLEDILPQESFDLRFVNRGDVRGVPGADDTAGAFLALRNLADVNVEGLDVACTGIR